MSNLKRESLIVASGKEYLVNDLLKNIETLNPEVSKNFFQSIGLTVPRSIRIWALKETLKDRVQQTRYERRTLADELSYRLSWFNEFTELQLENLLVFYDDPKLNKVYFDNLWLNLFSYLLEKGVRQEDLAEFIKKVLANNNKIPFEPKAYNGILNPIFFDEPNYIDGQSLEKIRPVLYKSSTVTEIRELGTKYNVDVPRRLKKNELLDIIISELKERGKYSEELENELRGMSVLVIQRYAKDNDIKASSELKKEEVIEYVLSNAKETKESYFAPSSNAAYDLEIKEVGGQELEEIVSQEDKVEPIQEVIVEETKVDEEGIDIVTEEINLEDEMPELQSVAKVEETEEVKEVIEKVEVSRESKPVTNDNEPIIIEAARFSETNNKKTTKSIVEKELEILNKTLVTNVEEPKKKKGFFRVLGMLILIFLTSIIIIAGIYAIVNLLGWTDSATAPNQVAKIVAQGYEALEKFVRQILDLLYKFWELIGLKK